MQEGRERVVFSLWEIDIKHPPKYALLRGAAGLLELSIARPKHEKKEEGKLTWKPQNE